MLPIETGKDRVFRGNWADKCLLKGVVDRTWETDAIYVGDWQEAIIDVHVFQVTGTTPTLVPEVLVSGITGEFKHRRTIIDPLTEGNLTRVTAPTVEGTIQAAGMYHCHICCAIGQRLRMTLTLGGTDPVFHLEIWVHLK